MKDFLLKFSGDTDGTSGADGNNRVYKAVLNRGTSQEEQATSDRHFCSKCSAMLWLWDETWYDGRTPTSHTFFPWINSQSRYNLHRPHLLHPFASAIDEPELKAPEEMVRVSFRACQ
jgi:hypothetical protein